MDTQSLWTSFLKDWATLSAWIGTLIFSLGLVWFCIQLKRTDSKNRIKHHGIFKILIWVTLFLSFSLISYQIRWQMFGYFHPGFLRVQRGFDSRGDLLGCRFCRGELLDRQHLVLAGDMERNGLLTRVYPAGSDSVHLLGYHDALFGTSGLEKVLDANLMGRRVKTPADFFRLLSNAVVHRKMKGNPVVLTVSKGIQRKAAEAIHGKRGAVVVIDPRNGEVLALVSSPAFNPELLTRTSFNQLRNSKDSPFLNRAIQGLYPPGSTFKTLVAAAALESGVNLDLNCSGEYDCGPGEPVLRDYQYYSYKRKGKQFKGHQDLGLERALSKSCNVYFAKLAVDMGSVLLRDIAIRAGFNQVIKPAGPGLVSLPGQLPAAAELPLARCARMGIGQDDMLVTPMHLALVAGALGSDGMMYHPKYIAGEQTQSWQQVTSPRIAREVARKMIQVVETGTGKAARIPGVIVGGKTGTSEHGAGRAHALFIGFAPWPNPRIALAVVLEEGGTGGGVAAPIARQILEAADELGFFKEEPSDDGQKTRQTP